jgi:hypothetical protein
VNAPESTTTQPWESSNIGNKKTIDQVLDTSDVPSVTVIEPPSRSNTVPAEIDHNKFSEWLKLNPELSQPLETKRRGDSSSVDGTHRSMSPDSGDGSEAPSPPPTNFGNSLTMNLKRLSLPRSASLSSKSGHGRRWSGGEIILMSYTSKLALQKCGYSLISLQNLQPKLILKTSLSYILGSLALVMNFQ